MTQASSKPNVVLILGDHMGYGDIGPTGVPDISTPNLDRLAGEGMLLTDVTAAAPICSPSRAAILTGRHPARIGLEENVNFGRTDIGLPANEVTLARVMSDHGYATGLFGKWHLGAQIGSDPNSHGFDEFLGFHDWSIDYHSHPMMNGEAGLFHNRERVTRQGYSTDVFTHAAVDFIERQHERPFFAFVSYNAALPPHQSPEQLGDARTASTWHDGTRADYRGVVEALDAGVGQILATLERSGTADNTLVIFSYDHGGKELARRTPFFHGFATLWEGGIRVPMILRWPGRVAAGETFAQSVSLMDLLPTVCAALEVEPPPGRELDGVNLLPALFGSETLPSRDFFWRIAFRSRRQKAVRRGHAKYIWDATAALLFDVHADPGERNDLAYRRPELVGELQHALSIWEERFPDPHG